MSDTDRKILRWAGVFIGLLGLAYLSNLTSWKIAGCVLLMLWGNNMECAARNKGDAT